MTNESKERIERFREKLAVDIFDRWWMTAIDTLENGGPIESLGTMSLSDEELHYLASEASYEFVGTMLYELHMLYMNYFSRPTNEN